MKALLNLWVHLDLTLAPANTTAPAPPPDNSKTVLEPGGAHIPDQLSGGLAKLLSLGSWIVVSLCVVGLMVTAGRMAYAHKSGAEIHYMGLFLPMVACVIVGSASALVNFVVIR